MPLQDANPTPSFGGFGLRYMSWYQKTKSSAVNGAPSDHLCPCRRKMVVVLPSALTSYPFAMCGTISVPSGFQNRSLSWLTARMALAVSLGP